VEKLVFKNCFATGFQKEDKGKKKRNEMSVLCNVHRKNLDYHNRLETDDTMSPKSSKEKFNIT
jgi:hypothetical protein